MPKGYWVVRLDVTDAEVFKRYQALIGDATSKYDARYLVRGGSHQAVEGSSRSRNVVVEFPSYQAALDCYNSAEYAEPLAIRKQAAESDFLIIEGLNDT